MPVSPYLRDLRAVVGHRLLLMPAVAAIVRDGEGRVLVLQKAEDGGWSLPAGAIDPGESPRDAVVRETAEETGLAVTSARLVDTLGGRPFRTTYPNGDRVEFTVCVFECQVGPGRPTAADGEAARFAWVAPGEVAARLDLPTPPPCSSRAAGRTGR